MHIISTIFSTSLLTLIAAPFLAGTVQSSDLAGSGIVGLERLELMALDTGARCRLSLERNPGITQRVIGESGCAAIDRSIPEAVAFSEDATGSLQLVNASGYTLAAFEPTDGGYVAASADGTPKWVLSRP
jgi:hypothetical protein